jgi:hypothetical protein
VRLTGKVTRRVQGRLRTVTVTRQLTGTLVDGTMRITLPRRLPHGRWKAVVTYAGDATYDGGRDRVRFRR